MRPSWIIADKYQENEAFPLVKCIRSMICVQRAGDQYDRIQVESQIFAGP